MSEFISKYEFGDISVNFILNNKKRAVMILLPNDMECDFFTEKNMGVYERSSLANLQLECYNAGMFSNSFKLSETLSLLKFKEQYTEEIKLLKKGYSLRNISKITGTSINTIRKCKALIWFCFVNSFWYIWTYHIRCLTYWTTEVANRGDGKPSDRRRKNDICEQSGYITNWYGIYQKTKYKIDDIIYNMI